MEEKKILKTPLIDAIKLHKSFEEIQKIAKSIPDPKLEKGGNYQSDALSFAVLHQDKEKLLLFLIKEFDFNVNEVNELGYNLTSHLVRNNFSKEFYEKLVKEHNLCLNIRSAKGMEPLSWACLDQNKKAVEILIELGAKVRDDLLYYTLSSRDEYSENVVDILKLLINNGANVNYLHNGETLLHILSKFAITESHYSARYICQAIRFLLDAGIDINSKNLKGETPLIIFTKRNYIKDVVYASDLVFNMLLDNGADTNVADINGETPLKSLVSYYTCCETCDYETCNKYDDKTYNCPVNKVNLLIKYGADIDEFGGGIDNPLLRTIEYEKTILFNTLLKYGANTNVAEKDVSALMLALLAKNATDFIGILISKGADIYHKDNSGKNVFHYAVDNSDYVVFSELFEKIEKKLKNENDGVNWDKAYGNTVALANIQDGDGNTPLLYLLNRRDIFLSCNGLYTLPIFAKLLSVSDVNMKNKEGKSIVDIIQPSIGFDRHVHYCVLQGLLTENPVLKKFKQDIPKIFPFAFPKNKTVSEIVDVENDDDEYDDDD